MGVAILKHPRVRFSFFPPSVPSTGGVFFFLIVLDPSVVCTNCLSDGLTSNAPGEEASQTSSNNFINLCAGSNLPLTNGIQLKTASCNSIPMGLIPAANNVPSVSFTNPPNGADLPANTLFTITMKVLNMEMGHFTNATSTYVMAPQQLNGAGIIKGHSHITMQLLSSATSTDPLDPTKFAFFKGLNNPTDGNGELSADVTKGVPAGSYRICSITTSANHASVVMGIAQRGSTEDCIRVSCVVSVYSMSLILFAGHRFRW